MNSASPHAMPVLRIGSREVYSPEAARQAYQFLVKIAYLAGLDASGAAVLLRAEQELKKAGFTSAQLERLEYSAVESILPQLITRNRERKEV